MSKLEAGTTLNSHEKFNWENCVLCAKPLGAKPSEVLVDGDNKLITSEEYNSLLNMGQFASTYPVGSTCVNKFSAEVVA